MLYVFQAAEVASRIQQKKEMGCKAFEVVHVDQGAPQESKVLRTLGGNSSNANFIGKQACMWIFLASFGLLVVSLSSVCGFCRVSFLDDLIDLCVYIVTDKHCKGSRVL